LFGHEKGAFTGANARSAGRFEQAEGGTLFLDEIGDMPMEAQTRLLRVLQQGEYTTVGGRTHIKTNVRIVAATNKDLRILIQQGLFREDLFFRLNVVPLRLPPLRERTEDIPDLVRHFFKLAAAEGLPQKHMEGAAMERMKRYRWPGNIRELENLIRRLAALYPQEVVSDQLVEAELGHDAPLATRATAAARSGAPLPASGSGAGDEDATLMASVDHHLTALFRSHGEQLPPPVLYHRIVREIEIPLISAALSATRGNQIKAAELLGLNRNTLRKKVRDLDIRLMRSPR
jgi:two-component system nitrogen regulation response regulator GlnG